MEAEGSQVSTTGLCRGKQNIIRLHKFTLLVNKIKSVKNIRA
jgi:hypothetical protein